MSFPLLVLALAVSTSDPDTTLRLPRNGVVEIDTRLRDVVVRIGSSDMVTVHGAQAELDGGTMQVGGDERRARGPGPVEVVVPAWSRLEVSSMTGNLTFTGTPERLHAETVGGFIHVNGGTGIVELETVAGAVVVTDFRGTHLAIDATGDNVTVTNATGSLEVDNVNGNVTLRGIRATSVTASSINGYVDFAGMLVPNGNYEFASQNKDVILTLSGDVSARMQISTMNGELKTDIPASTTGRANLTPLPDRGKTKDKGHTGDDGEHSFTVVYGGGSAHVSIDVFNGNVVVKRSGGKP